MGRELSERTWETVFSSHSPKTTDRYRGHSRPSNSGPSTTNLDAIASESPSQEGRRDRTRAGMDMAPYPHTPSAHGLEPRRSRSRKSCRRVSYRIISPEPYVPGASMSCPGRDPHRPTGYGNCRYAPASARRPLPRAEPRAVTVLAEACSSSALRALTSESRAYRYVPY